MDFTNDVWKSGVNSFLHGWSADASAEAAANVFDYTKGNGGGTGTYKQYLTTEGFADATPLKTSSSYASKTYFYTIPNDNVDDGKGGVTNNTKLVVAGKFVEKAGGAAEVVYYSLPINATYNSTSHKYELPGSSAGKAFQVCPNYFYKCSVTIRTKGSLSPNTNLTPQAAEIKVEVLPFTPVTQSAEFN